MNKQETIKYLTDLMGVAHMAHFKGRATGVVVKEYPDPDSVAICVDLILTDGSDHDGEPVCEGLNPCTVKHEGREVTGHVFCIIYDPRNDNPALIFGFDGEDGKTWMDLQPDELPEQVLTDVTQWLEKTMVPAKPKTNDVTSFFYYMWNKWSEEECKVVFKDDFYSHFWNKWCEAYDKMNGPRGAAELFYMMLSDTNRNKIVARALECYDGMTEK